MLLLGVCDAPRSRTAGISSATPAAPATGSSATGSAATRSAATRSAATGSAATGSSATGSAAAGCARLVLSRSRISSGSRGSSQRSTPSHPDGQTEAGCSRRTNMATVALDDAPTSAPAPSTTSSPRILTRILTHIGRAACKFSEDRSPSPADREDELAVCRAGARDGTEGIDCTVAQRRTARVGTHRSDESVGAVGAKERGACIPADPAYSTNSTARHLTVP